MSLSFNNDVGRSQQPSHVKTIIIVLVAVGLAVVALSWIGFRNYIDDVLTIRGALLWLKEFPYLGTTHWEVRQPFLLSIAASIKLFGLSEISVLLPNILAYLGLIVLTTMFFSRYSNWVHGLVSGVLLIGVPVYAFAATTIFPGIIELLLVVSSVYCFCFGLLNGQSRRRYLVLAGLFAGLAVTTRETSYAIVLFYLVLFVVRYGGSRRVFLLVAIGLSAPIMIDTLFYYVQSGDALYRVRIVSALYHPWGEAKRFDYLNPALPQPRVSKQIEIRKKKPGKNLEHIGPVDTKNFLNSFVSLLTNHEYGVTFFFMLPAIGILFFIKPRDQWVRKVLLLFCLLALCWFITVTYIFGLRPHPRYYQPVVYAAVLLNATAIYMLIIRKLHLLSGLAMVIAIAGSALAFDLESERLHEERLLIELAERKEEPIYAPPSVVNAARFFVQHKGLASYVSDTPPPNGSLYIYSRESIKPLSESERKQYEPTAEWDPVKKIVPRQRILGYVLDYFGLKDKLPESITNKIDRPGPVIVLYRVMSKST